MVACEMRFPHVRNQSKVELPHIGCWRNLMFGGRVQEGPEIEDEEHLGSIWVHAQLVRGGTKREL